MWVPQGKEEGESHTQTHTPQPNPQRGHESIFLSVTYKEELGGKHPGLK